MNTYQLELHEIEIKVLYAKEMRRFLPGDLQWINVDNITTNNSTRWVGVDWGTSNGQPIQWVMSSTI